jgi:hypothetical protein
MWVYSIAVQVAGVYFRKDNANTFCREKTTDKYLTMEQEPTNKYDKNAIKIYGVVKGKSLHIGYVPAPLAKRIAEDEVFTSMSIHYHSHKYKSVQMTTGVIANSDTPIITFDLFVSDLPKQAEEELPKRRRSGGK